MNIYIYEYNIYIYICQRERSENIHTINVWDAIMAQDPMREQKGLFAVRHDQRVRELVPIELLYPEQGSICSQYIYVIYIYIYTYYIFMHISRFLKNFVLLA